MLKKNGTVPNIKILFYSLIVFWGGWISPVIAQENKAPQDFSSVYTHSRHSVVTILTYQTGGSTPKGIGSGFFAAPGVVVTNAHVVEGAGYLEVKVNLRDKPIRVVRVISLDKDADVAVLQTEEPGMPLSLAKDIPESGEPIIVISSPMGLEKTVSQGIISGFRERNGQKYLQISASISPGSSGGPIFDHRGRVLGITAFILEGEHTQNLNFGIPAMTIQRVLDGGGYQSGNKKLHVGTNDGEIVITD